MKCLGKGIGTEGRFVVARGWERKEWGVTVYRYEVSLGDNENVLELRSGDGCTALYIDRKPLNCIF